MAQRLTGKALLEKKIGEIDRKMANAEEQLKSYKQQKSDLEKELNDIKMKELSELMDKKNMSIDDLYSMIEDK